jgi:hypothetical protein
MRCVRSKASHGALLALFALTIHLVLSFGHFHSNGFAQAADMQGRATAQPPCSPHQLPDGIAPDFCAVCATTALSRTLIAAAPPILPLPTVFAVGIEATIPDFVLPSLRRAAFRSRAPPHS